MTTNKKPGCAGRRIPGELQSGQHPDSNTSTSMGQRNTLSAALHYAGMGWGVFPAHSMVDGVCTCGGEPDCGKSKGKHPRAKQAPNGFKNATRTPSVINRWASVWEKSNIAIAAGSGSGIFVVDVDPRNGGHEAFDDLVARHGKLPDTLTASTGGGGRHYVFKQPSGFKAAHKTLGAGIDILSDGKYFIVEPSVTNKPYTWLDCEDMPKPGDIAAAPDWLIQLITSPGGLRTPAPLLPPNRNATAGGAGAPVGQAPISDAPLSGGEIDEIRDALAHVTGGDDRDRWTEVGMALHSTGAGNVAFELWTDWSKQSAKFNAKDQRRVWNSFKPRSDGIGTGTLFKLARENGWQQPPVAGVDTSVISEQAAALLATGKTEIRVVGPLEGIKPTLIDRIPGVLGQVEDYYNATCIVQQPAFSAVASITLGSVALGRHYVARATRDSYSGLYLCEVVGTGGGKEHARTVVEEFLSAADLGALIGPAGYTSAAGVFSTLIDQPVHFAFIDELGRHLAASKKSGDSHQQQVITELLKLWGELGAEYRYRGYSLTGMPDKLKAEYKKVICAPSITLLGASTPAALYDAVGNAGIADGFLNRLLFFFGDEEARADAFAKRPTLVPLPPDVVAWLKEVQCRETQEPKGNLTQFMSRNPEVRPDPEILLYDDQALGVMHDLQSDVEKVKNIAKKSGTAELFMRTTEKATRLALIAAVSDRSAEIKLSHAKWAARRAMASDSALERAAEGNIAETSHGKLCNDIWRVVNRRMPEGLAEGALSGACRAYREAPMRDRKAAIDTLIADGKLAPGVRLGANGAKYHRYVTAERHDE